MDANEWLHAPKTIAKSRKSYAHFDARTDMSKQAVYVSNPSNVVRHGFYPFIHYTKNMTKYSEMYGKKLKKRDICYAAHVDCCIYQYYSFLLNKCYNQRVHDLGISSVAVAYRTDLHKTNIHFAKQAIDYIRKNSPCYIMIGDFTSFFDHLDHEYLKRQWCSLLSVPRLPNDHYAIFKNITRYSIWELSDLLELNGLKDTEDGRRKLNSRYYALSKVQFTRDYTG